MSIAFIELLDYITFKYRRYSRYISYPISDKKNPFCYQTENLEYIPKSNNLGTEIIAQIEVLIYCNSDVELKTMLSTPQSQSHQNTKR